MIDPQVIVKANYNRTLVTVRVTAINSTDWVDIVGTKIDLAWDANFADVFYSNQTTHYKVRAYIEDDILIPDRTVYARVTMTKNDDSVHTYEFNFVLPHPIIGTIKDENGTQYVTSMRKMDTAGNLTPRNYKNKAVGVATAAYIDVMADEAGEMIIANKWKTPILVENITQGTAQVSVAMDASTTVAVDNGDVVRVTESVSFSTFTQWNRNGNSVAFCKGVSAHVITMPSMDKFTPEADAMPDGFFYYFNSAGTITSFPEGSFDTHKFKYVGTGSIGESVFYPFASFNDSGALTSLPEGSFDFSNLIGYSRREGYGGWGHHAFYRFNAYGALTSLPEGSFDFDNLLFAGNGALILSAFNANGALTSLPEGSFGFSSLEDGIRLPSGFFKDFNKNGQLSSLKDGTFHFKEGATYDLSRATNLFEEFNYSGRLSSLPAHSFNFPISGVIQPYSFKSFNAYGALTSLPEGSFNTENMYTTDSSVFSMFNAYGALTSLPEGSFKMDSFEQSLQGGQNFLGFNKNGSLKTLPKGSFNFKVLTVASNQFCAEFNSGGALEYLPVDAFSIENVTASYQTSADSWQAFGSFNRNGKLVKSDTNYNPNHVFPSSAKLATLNAYYYNPDTGAQTTETIARGNPLKYFQADYFSVTYAQSPTYTTDLASEYLSGREYTFSASSTDTEYYLVPTITTAGGVDVPITDNGNGTYTFMMPEDDIEATFAVLPRPAV